MPSTPVVVLDSTLTDIANAIRGKNGSSDTYKPSEMPAAINAIPSGGGDGIPREVNASGVYGFPTQNFTFSFPSNATDVAGYAFKSAFQQCLPLTSVDFGSLATVSGAEAFSHAFSGCTGLTSVDLSSLTTVSGSGAFDTAFQNCSFITSVDLSSLTTISGYGAFSNTFQGCGSLTSVDLSALTTVSASRAFASAFYNCSALTSVDLSSLTTISGDNALQSAFASCTSLASLSFPALTSSSFGSFTNQFNYMLYNVTGCTLHFPAAAQAKIATLTGYPNFGGTNTTVLFDL